MGDGIMNRQQIRMFPVSLWWALLFVRLICLFHFSPIDIHDSKGDEINTRTHLHYSLIHAVHS